MTSPVYYPLEPRFRAIVVGASSGLGAALVRQLASQRYHVAAVARREANLAALRDSVGKDLVLPYVHDVTEYEQVPMLFDQITRDLGGLDLIIYCAAVQPPVALHEYNFEKDEAMVTTNFLGAVAWLNQAALRFERARAGHIVGISSIAGDRGRVGSPAYNESRVGHVSGSTSQSVVAVWDRSDDDQAGLRGYGFTEKCPQDVLGGVAGRSGGQDAHCHSSPSPGCLRAVAVAICEPGRALGPFFYLPALELLENGKEP
ncbi:MAG TPA: SDR family NAD(P)-dependent oxidoreductase [Promineifilum sp.]|nr:SDR family NAD(P)-dependent oxidoreductase [Promineifilum sp.]